MFPYLRLKREWLEFEKKNWEQKLNYIWQNRRELITNIFCGTIKENVRILENGT